MWISIVGDVYAKTSIYAYREDGNDCGEEKIFLKTSILQILHYICKVGDAQARTDRDSLWYLHFKKNFNDIKFRNVQLLKNLIWSETMRPCQHTQCCWWRLCNNIAYICRTRLYAGWYSFCFVVCVCECVLYYIFSMMIKKYPLLLHSLWDL